MAAGAGARAGPGEPKQFRPILGVPMLLRALRPFTSHPDVGHVVVALPAGFETRPPDWLGKLVGERLVLVAGGATRAHSVRAGLSALAAHVGIVLVHDGARPFVTRDTIDGVLDKARAATKEYFQKNENYRTFGRAAEWFVGTGWPGPVTAAAAEVQASNVLTDAPAKVIIDKWSVDQAIDWADKKIKEIYATLG